MKDPDRILLVRMSHLGDVVCALPLYHALRGAFPRARIAWVVQPEFEALVAGLSGLQCTFRFERTGGARAWVRLRRGLKAFAPDLAVDAQANLKSATATFLSGAPRRAGLHPSDWRERAGARALTEHAPPSGVRHAVERMLHLARHVAGERAPRYDPDLSPAERADGRAELARLLPGGASPCVLHLARPGDPRAWPAERFGALARRLSAAGRAVVICSGPREEQEGLRLARELGDRDRVRHLVGQRDLRRLAALLAAAAERGGRFAGVDSGPMHLACSVGLPVVCLAGPQDPARTGPWSSAGPEPASVLRSASPPACAPCLRRRCDHADGPVCMTAIEVEAVAAALGT